nr:hypothetical protein BdHM001_14140 [Bdellovibrio sp. HM001]
MRIGMYCNWGVKRVDGGFYVPAIHEKYLRAFREKANGSLVLLSKLDTSAVKESDVFIADSDVEILPLPPFKSYLHSIKCLPQIAAGLFHFARKCQYYYIRTFEPFSWLLPFFKRSGAVLNYHFVANPFEAIWGNSKSTLPVKVLRSVVFYPEFFLTCVAAAVSRSSCNGPSVLPRVPFFLRRRMNVVIESTLQESDYFERQFVGECEKIKILSVGYLRYAKGTGDLINALALFKEWVPNAKFILSIVGDGEDRLNLEEMVNSLGLQSEVVFYGHQSGRTLSERYEENDVFVMPSHAETGPRVLLEAMARGMFCISTDVGYVRTVLSYNENLQGIIVEKNSPLEICKALNWYLGHRSEARSMSMNAFEASKRYSMKGFVNLIFPGQSFVSTSQR